MPYNEVVKSAHFLLLAATLSLGKTPSTTYVANGKSGGHIYSVRFEEVPFQPRGRQVFWRLIPGSEGSGSSPTKGTYVPAFRYGGKVYEFKGRDSWSYEEVKSKKALAFIQEWGTELKSLKITVDGKSWPVPKSLYFDLLNPHPAKEYVKTSLSRDGSVLHVALLGSDGAGSYTVRWTFRKSGAPSRTVDHNC